MRPAVDVVCPFAGSDGELREVVDRLGALAVAPGDTLTVVDNRPTGAPSVTSRPPVRLIRATERQSSYFARNRGARDGTGEWILFVDADTEPPTDLADRYFDPPPGERCGVVAGGIVPEGPPATGRQPIAAHWAHRTRHMQQSDAAGRGRWAYAQTANALVRRQAFEAVGGFRDDIRGTGDADLCFRLKAAGWGLESRERAAVVHRGRTTVPALVRQLLRHAAGGAWLNRVYPGSAPRRSLARLAGGTIRDLLALIVATVSLGLRQNAAVLDEAARALDVGDRAPVPQPGITPGTEGQAA